MSRSRTQTEQLGWTIVLKPEKCLCYRFSALTVHNHNRCWIFVRATDVAITHVGCPKTPDCTIISASKCTFESFGSTSLAKQSLFCAVLPDSCGERQISPVLWLPQWRLVSLIQLPVRINVIFNQSIVASGKMFDPKIESSLTCVK